LRERKNVEENKKKITLIEVIKKDILIKKITKNMREQKNVEENKKKITLIEVIKKDMLIKKITENMT
jgi:hypothetical protein